MVLMIHLQGSSGDADIKNRLGDTVGEGEVGQIERVKLKHTHNRM